MKMLAGEGPKSTDSDSVKNDFFKEYIYDTTKGECAEGLSCVQAQTADKEQSCQKCNFSSRDAEIVAIESFTTGGDAYVPTAEEVEAALKNQYPDGDGNPVYYKCYSDVLATRVILSAGAFVLAAVTSMV